MKVKKSDLRALIVAKREAFVEENDLQPKTKKQLREETAALKQRVLAELETLKKQVRAGEEFYTTVRFRPGDVDTGEWQSRRTREVLEQFDRDLALLDLSADEFVSVSPQRGQWSQYI